MRADVFLLADGTRHEGTATEDGSSLVITTFDGKTIRVAKQSIKGTIAEPKRNEYHLRLRALKPNDANGHAQLGAWARSNALEKEATARFQAALQIDPANETAGRALNYELRDGKWQVPEAPLTIGARPQPKTAAEKEPTREDLQSLVKRLSKIALNPLGRRAQDLSLAREASAQMEIYTRLLIPPGYPKAVPNATTPVRVRAARALGLTQDRRAMQALINSSIYDPDAAVRYESAKALPLLKEPVALRRLVDIAISGDAKTYPWSVRKYAARALRHYGDKEVVERLIRELTFELAGGNARDPKNKLRGGGAVGIASDNPLGIPGDTPDLGLPFEQLYPVMSALREVTGQTFDKGDKDVQTWLAWWRKEGSTFVMKDEIE